MSQFDIKSPVVNVPVTLPEPREAAKVALSNVPVTVLVFAAIAWYLAANGIYPDQSEMGLASLVNPLYYIGSLFLHSDWAHFQSNMTFWIPFGIALTVLTDNKHVFLVAVLSHLLMAIVSAAMLRGGIGMSGAVSAVEAAALVRSTGYAMQNASMETLQAAIVGLFVPAAAGFLLIMILAGNSPIGHFEHFTAFVFGGAIEAMYVFGNHESEATERAVPGRLRR